MQDEFCRNKSITFSNVPPIFCSGSLKHLAFFSSNSCIFYHQTQKNRFDCPTGSFQCDGNGTRFFYEGNDLTYRNAITYCKQRNASLCKYAGGSISLTWNFKPGSWRHQIIWFTISTPYDMIHITQVHNVCNLHTDHIRWFLFIDHII